MDLSTEQTLRENKKGLGFIEADCFIWARKQAIEFAQQSNPEHYNACALYIYEDGSFYIGERTYSNVCFSPTMTFGKNFVITTVSANDYPAKDIPFDVAHFCSFYGIKLHDRAPADNIIH